MKKIKNNTINNKILYFDIMNILSCIAVIALHHNGLVHSFQNTLAWKQSLIVECGFYWAVPVFLMISGANLLDYRKKYSTSEFFLKRTKRTVIPWLFWSVVFLILRVALGLINLGDTPVKQALILIFTYKVESVYWYFGALFACYLAIPVLSYLVDKREILWYITGINFIFVSVIPILKKLFQFPWSLDVPIAGSLIIFVLLGYLLNTTKLTKKQRYFIYFLGLFGFLFRFIYTYIFSIKNGQTNTTIKGYAIFHSVFLAVAVFVFLKEIDWNKYIKSSFIPWISKISACSFGIYLIHRFIMTMEEKILPISNTCMIWRVFMIPVTYLISLLCVMILKKIPILKKTV